MSWSSWGFSVLESIAIIFGSYLREIRDSKV